MGADPAAAGAVPRALLRAWTRFSASALCASALAAAVGGCAEIRHDQARAEAERIAASGGLAPEVVAAGRFDLLAYRRLAPGDGDRLVVYIEGDGLAWINRGQISEDPTPTDPVALRLAARDDAASVLYLARPCQFVTGSEARNCAPRYWSTARYAPEVVEAAGDAIDLVKTQAGKREIELVGYSGGGVIATLLAARRTDVMRVMTVAANLDLPSWTAYHHVTPLSQSLNPTDFAASLAKVPQVIFVGERDDVVPPSLIERYREALPAAAPVAVVPVAGFSHYCCWSERWPELLRKARSLP
ncbi:MAG TPA: dienelactone hydrolase family protein [Alphaproteobacteria bacterium]|nr:dienelactone hydrolase family protein [Alphaproteobacteria bacterium]